MRIVNFLFIILIILVSCKTITGPDTNPSNYLFYQVQNGWTGKLTNMEIHFNQKGIIEDEEQKIEFTVSAEITDSLKILLNDFEKYNHIYAFNCADCPVFRLKYHSKARSSEVKIFGNYDDEGIPNSLKKVIEFMEEIKLTELEKELN